MFLLRRANLERADLGSATLEGANLEWAKLDGANRGSARLERLDSASLDDVNLASANLEGANLSYARLRGAILDGANVGKASFFRAKLDDTWFSGLRGANIGFGLAETEPRTSKRDRIRPHHSNDWISRSKVRFTSFRNIEFRAPWTSIILETLP